MPIEGRLRTLVIELLFYSVIILSTRIKKTQRKHIEGTKYMNLLIFS